MDFVSSIAPADLVGTKLVAESNQFAVYAVGLDTYLLVQRHESQPWAGIELSGDALFRISGLLGEATRDLYREVAGKLSPSNRAQPVDAMERRDPYRDGLTTEGQTSPMQPATAM